MRFADSTMTARRSISRMTSLRASRWGAMMHRVPGYDALLGLIQE